METVSEQLSEQLLEATKQIVDKEIKELQEWYKKEYSSYLSHEEAVRSYLNNFRCNFIRKGEGSNNYRLLEHDNWNETHGNSMKKSTEKYGTVYPKNYVSELYKTKTPKEFFEDFDNAAIAQGFNLDDLDKKIRKVGGNPDNLLAISLLPVYVRLRAMGYKSDELTS